MIYPQLHFTGHTCLFTASEITGALPDDKAAILREFDKAIAEFPEDELKAYRSRIWHL